MYLGLDLMETMETMEDGISCYNTTRVGILYCECSLPWNILNGQQEATNEAVKSIKWRMDKVL